MNNYLFTSNTNEWATPQELFDRLNKVFKFTLDPCATKENAKCEKFYTIEENGLAQDWTRDSVFMNPPYGREVGLWMQKAYEESLKGAQVVCLVFARTDTKWWSQWAKRGTICFLKGRVKFLNKMGKAYPAPSPSAIVIFGEFFNQ